MHERADRFRHLRWSLQALAASNQPSMFPEWAVTPDHLAVDFEQCAAAVLDNHKDELEGAQRAALAAIGELLAKMYHDAVEFDVDLWSTSALATSDQWNEVRRLAFDALDAFGWPSDLPPADVTDVPDLTT